MEEDTGPKDCCHTLREVDRWIDVILTRLGKDFETAKVSEMMFDPEDPQREFILYCGSDVKRMKRSIKNNFYRDFYHYNLRIEFTHHHTFPPYRGGECPSVSEIYHVYRVTDFTSVRG